MAYAGAGPTSQFIRGHAGPAATVLNNTLKGTVWKMATTYKWQFAPRSWWRRVC